MNKTTSNESIDDVPSVTQTSKQVNQKNEQNHEENKNTLHTSPKKEFKENNNTKVQSSTILMKINHYLKTRRKKQHQMKVLMMCLP